MLERELSFDAAAYSLDAVQRAAYRLSDKLSIELHVLEDGYLCRAYIDSADEAEAERLVAELRNQALDEVLRERIRSETAGVRNVILSLAFADTGLVRQD